MVGVSVTRRRRGARRVRVETLVWPEIRDRMDRVGLERAESMSQTLRRWIAEGLSRDERP